MADITRVEFETIARAGLAQIKNDHAKDAEKPAKAWAAELMAFGEDHISPPGWDTTLDGQTRGFLDEDGEYRAIIQHPVAAGMPFVAIVYLEPTDGGDDRTQHGPTSHAKEAHAQRWARKLLQENR